MKGRGKKVGDFQRCQRGTRSGIPNLKQANEERGPGKMGNNRCQLNGKYPTVLIKTAHTNKYKAINNQLLTIISNNNQINATIYIIHNVSK